MEPDHAGLGEIVRATRGGLLCQPEDLESLTSCLAELLQNPARAAELAKTGRKTVLEKFSADAMAAEFEKVILEVMDSQTAQVQAG
ncbi:MAG: glycosyltransferase [Verrucomicrobiales bacterium]|nr:glycosyltransferase [Verrucomicrobiales bacterium]